MIKKCTSASFLFCLYTLFLVGGLSACASNKRGCPSNGANVGAERLLGNEKIKKSKFKIKGMN